MKVKGMASSMGLFCQAIILGAYVGPLRWSLL